jgi:hypothetical protein
MTRDKVVIALTAVGSAWCWWPVIREPSLEFSRLILLGLIALMALFATLVANRRWLSVVVAATLGSFLGMCAGQAMWPSDDGIANSYAGIVIVIATLAVLVLALVAGLTGRAFSVTNPIARPVLWIALMGCIAFGPVLMAVTPPLVARRIARNDRLATERLAAMKKAIDSARAEADGARQGCDVHALSHRYSGPTFSESDWLRVLGDNAVKEDGYVFLIKCLGNGTYKINAIPDRVQGDGTRNLCADDSGKITIGMVYDEQQWRSAMNDSGLPRCP